LPNISNVLRFQHERGGEYAMHFASALPKLLAAFVVGYNYFTLPEQGVGRAVDSSVLSANLLLIALAAIPLLWLLWNLLQMQMNVDDRRHLRIIHEWFTIPILLALIAAALTGKNWLQPKYLIFSAPILLLALAFSWLWLNRRWKRIAVAACSLLVIGIALAHFYDTEHYGRREDWRGAARILDRELGAESKLVLTQGTWWLLDYYAPATKFFRTPEFVPPQTPKNDLAFVVAMRRELAGMTYAYYLRIDTFQNDVDPFDHVPETMDMLGSRVETLRLNPRVELMKWQLR
jgi:hypothetical protein